MPLSAIENVRRIFITRAFLRQNRKIGLNDAALCKAVSEIASGLHNGNLGNGVFKKRIALDGRGKRGSVRTLNANGLAQALAAGTIIEVEDDKTDAKA